MLAYSFRGNIDAPSLVFLHGFLGTKEDWDPIVSLLKRDFACYAVDLPGHGNSSYEEPILHAIVKTLDDLNLKKTSLIGYSLGGRLAQLLKNDFPERFSSLVLLSAHFGLKNTSEKIARLKQDLQWSAMLETMPFVEFLKVWYEQPLFVSLQKRKDLLETLLQRRLHQNPHLLSKVLKSCSLGKMPFFSPEYCASSKIWLYGEDDQKYEKLYHAFLPKSQIRKVPRSGHTVHLENPLKCAEIIRSFICQ